MATLVLVTSGPAARLRAADTLAGSPPPDTVIYPQGNPAAHTPRPDEAPHTGSGPAILVIALLCAATGAWLWTRSRGPGGKILSRVTPKLSVAETRSLGNRQYLVVAAYEERRFLLGVCPGRIELLTNLDDAPSAREGKS